MRWRNTETPTFAGSDGTKITGPDVVETFELLDRDENVAAAFTKDVEGVFTLNVNGNLNSPIVGSSSAYEDSGSFQPVGVDFELSPTAGSDEGTDPKTLAAIMGNVL